MERLGRLAAQLTAASGAVVTNPPWDMPPPKDFPPPKPEPLSGPVVNNKVPVRTAVSADYQREYLLRCGVTEAAFRGALDPAMVASSAGRATAVANLPPPPDAPKKPPAPASGGAFLSGRWKLLNGPALRCGEPLIVTLGQGRSEKHPKGTMSYSEIRVASEAGEPLMEIQNAGLALDAALVAAAKKTGGPAKVEDPKAGKSFVSAVQFTPDMCAGYCYFIPNRIHNDMDTAKEFGFREPILAGTQCMHILTAHLYTTFGVPKTLTAEFQFPRPVFWNDRLELWASQDAAAKGGVGEYVLLNPEGKVASSMVVEQAAF